MRVNSENNTDIRFEKISLWLPQIQLFFMQSALRCWYHEKNVFTGCLFNFSAIKRTKRQTIPRKFWHFSELFWWDLLWNVTLGPFWDGTVKKTILYLRIPSTQPHPSKLPRNQVLRSPRSRLDPAQGCLFVQVHCILKNICTGSLRPLKPFW